MIGRIPILDVQPVVERGRWPAKAVPGESFEVSATIFREGHEILAAAVVMRDPAGLRRPQAGMSELADGTDRYGAEVTVTSEGLWHFQVEAWGDPIARWQRDAAIKIPLGQDVPLMLAEGAWLFERAAAGIRAPRERAAARALAVECPDAQATECPDAQATESPDAQAARAALAALAARLRDDEIHVLDRLAAATSGKITVILRAFPLRELRSTSAAFPVMVHRERALYGSWYEFFPRSEGAKIGQPGRQRPVSGTLRIATRRLDAIAAMGFDVVYLPPVHPIGTTARKGANNSLTAVGGDPGSPWAIGSPAGGHDAIHPDLGSLADFDAFVGRARELGMEVALDLALQTSPDHPWVRAHPEWFTARADGLIAHAENPPKKYQDIYPLNFDNDPEGIHAEVLRIIRHWIGHGIRIFRVDNPHTKPLAFWERLLAEVADIHPDVLFLAEAFTRPAMMRALAALGFHQSYTYFTWRNSAWELTEYLRELSGPAAPYMRPNFFANTPDILSEYLQHGGPGAFRVRAVLAAMLSPSWGIYSGYELCENVAVVPGSEEYLDSEKYQYRVRDWAHTETYAGDISPLITRLNMIRRAHPALHYLRNLRFHHSDRPEILCFSKSTVISAPEAGRSPRRDTVLVVANLDPLQPREATIWLDASALGAEPEAGLIVTDELSGESYRWGHANYVRLDPAVAPAHILTVAGG